MTKMRAQYSVRLRGNINMPGDKSISHRAVIFAACAFGKTEIKGLLQSNDVRATIKCLQKLGVEIKNQKNTASTQKKISTSIQEQNSTCCVFGAGVEALQQPKNILNCANSGTSARLLAGLIASRPFSAIITGDASLRQRPMDKIFEQLKPFGVEAQLREGRFLPLTIKGILKPLPLKCKLTSASAQVKSALLLFALTARGESQIIEPVPSRDHSERMLQNFGADLLVIPLDQQNEQKDNRQTAQTPGRRLILKGGKPLKAPEIITVPGDISSAAFFILAATICQDSDICLRDIGINPTRMGFIETLNEMGANISITPIKKRNNNTPNNTPEDNEEPSANIRIRSADLRAVEVPPERAASMIDEYPALAIAAARAEGNTVMHGIGELRSKECDRLQAICNGLAACGIQAKQDKDSLTIYGQKKSQKSTPLKNINKKQKTQTINIKTYGDHRIAMSFLTLGLTLKNQNIVVDKSKAIATSFPDFQKRMQSIGAKIE